MSTMTPSPPPPRRSARLLTTRTPPLHVVAATAGVRSASVRAPRKAATRRTRRNPTPSTSGTQRNSGAAKSPVQSPNSALIAVLGHVQPSAHQTGLDRRDHRLLLKKRSLLLAHGVSVPKRLRSRGAVTAAVDATLAFGQQDAGTAVCVSPSGLLLTCSHCVAENKGDLDANPDKTHWLVFASGQVVGARCIAWDGRRDLALLKIVFACTQESSGSSAANNAPEPAIPTFPSIRVARAQPCSSPPACLVCIGHPGSEDLEASRPGIRTGYDVLHVSEGHFRGLASDQDPQDNSTIGAAMHDCWTYWGHSGAPLVDAASGDLVALHSSWDDETGMRRGVPWGAIVDFLSNWGVGADVLSPDAVDI